MWITLAPNAIFFQPSTWAEHQSPCFDPIKDSEEFIVQMVAIQGTPPASETQSQAQQVPHLCRSSHRNGAPAGAQEASDNKASVASLGIASAAAAAGTVAAAAAAVGAGAGIAALDGIVEGGQIVHHGHGGCC